MYGINTLYCFNRKNYTLQGDYFSSYFSYISIKLSKCDSSKSKTCKNQTDIDAFFQSLTFNVAYINFYFDYEDFETPVKSYIDDSLFFELEPYRVKKCNFYVMKSEIVL
jgi:hypothetical protein